ncbi:hypothetical protein TcasGA2_TC010737 [Tribolium castaneum]|uniref:Uncharacterized protein n=1 Tax=Tribolium castaneum TaxID=7070 RepID=D2CG61_TRICA|nr:hypothetical protein TcasGA2_TC010737 [Tribolium castaneum]
MGFNKIAVSWFYDLLEETMDKYETQLQRKQALQHKPKTPIRGIAEIADKTEKIFFYTEDNVSLNSVSNSNENSNRNDNNNNNKKKKAKKRPRIKCGMIVLRTRVGLPAGRVVDGHNAPVRVKTTTTMINVFVILP